MTDLQTIKTQVTELYAEVFGDDAIADRYPDDYQKLTTWQRTLECLKIDIKDREIARTVEASERWLNY